MITTDLIAELALEAEKENLIDFTGLKIDKETAYKMMASHAIDILENINEPYTDKDVILVTTITNLLVENFILNLKLEGKNETP